MNIGKEIKRWINKVAAPGVSVSEENMLESLVILIHEYQSKIIEAAALFQKYKGIDPSNLMCWRRTGLPGKGFVDPEHRVAYYYHGIGCCVRLPSGEVDWDFGHEGRLDGFDAWRLWRFAEKGTNQFPDFKRQETRDYVFRKAEICGIVHAPFKHLQDDLYYLQGGTVTE